MATDKKPKIAGNAVRSAFREKGESRGEQEIRFMKAILHPELQRDRLGPRKKSNAGPVKANTRKEPKGGV